jgi:hypothetical protein
MALTKISGNQIATSTLATVDSLTFLDGESVLRLPVGTEEQRPESPAVGTLRYNSDGDTAEVYKADDGTGNPGWLEVGAGGATLGKKGIIRTNADYIDEDIEIDPSLGDEYTHAFTHGPVEIRDGFTVTVEDGADWEIWGGEPEDPPEGTVLQYFHDVTPPTRYTLSANNLSDAGAVIPDLSVTITPTRSTSKIIIGAHISHNGRHVTSFGFQKAGSILTAGLPSSNNTNTQYAVMTFYDGADISGNLYQSSFTYADTSVVPGIPVTYTVAGTASWSGSVRDLLINDRDTNDMRGISSMFVMEIMGPLP